MLNSDRNTANTPHLLLPMLLALWCAAAPSRAAERAEPNRGGEVSMEAKDPRVALQRLTPAEGYEVHLFASEKDFPELANPVAMTFDARGRLWVATMPTYPQHLPGVPPHDMLLILEDADGDGRADRRTVFADGLYLPGGFELGDGGVYIAQQPNLMFLQDTDGDDIADRRRILLHGFGTEDSHHAISAFTWGPGGGLYFQEGTFLHSQVETPWGPVRLADAGVFRFEPLTWKLSVFVTYNFANPWGHAIDRWGQNFICDASNGMNYFGTAFSGHLPYPQKHAPMRMWTETKVRPTSGAEFIRSRHFPDEAQGNFLFNNVIGFHGVKQYRTHERGSGFFGEEVEPLLVSSDINFRPVDLQFGPDGALYICDWFNPLIGHMQYSIRDPQRDSSHGRIWRITYKHKPLLEPVNLEALSIPELLDQLRMYEDRTRYRARRELRSRDRRSVLAAAERWIGSLETSDEHDWHHMLEGLWLHQSLDEVNPSLLRKLLSADEPRARAAAVRVLQNWFDRVDGAMSLLRAAVHDPMPRTRLEAVRALSFVPTAEAAEVALQAVHHEMDDYLDYTLKETLRALEPHWKRALASGEPFAEDHPEAVRYLLAHIDRGVLVKMSRSEPVYHALLTRPGLDIGYRREALEALAERREISPLRQLFRAIEQNPAGSISDLARILAEWDAGELAGRLDDLKELAAHHEAGVVRSAAYAAMIAAQGSPESAYAMASRTQRGLHDYLGGVRLIQDRELRRRMYPRVRALMFNLPDHLAAQADQAQGAYGRYVRIELPRTGTLSLAEVEVFDDGDHNIAPAGIAAQSSTAHDGAAARAVDGSTDGIYRHHSVSHTAEDEQNPWWELDLGSGRIIRRIVVWNRQEQLGHRLEGFTLKVLDAEHRPVFVRADNPARRQVAFEVGGDLAGLVHRAAIEAVSHIPGHGSETFADLAGFIREDRHRQTAIAALLSVPEDAWLAEGAKALGAELLALIAATPLHRRDSQPFEQTMRLAEKAAAAMPEADARSFRSALREVGSSEQLDLGKLAYMKTCVNCHQIDGRGLPGAFPPLVGSDWLNDDERAIKIVLKGMMGPVEVRGRTYNSAMAPLADLLSDEEVAAVLTYVRNQWGNAGEAVEPRTVAEVRRRIADRALPWTAEELLEQHPLRAASR